MRQELAELCRQLRLAHVVEYVGFQQDGQVKHIAERLLAAELDGRRRAKLGKLVQQAGFPPIKTFEGYVYEQISFPNGSSKEMIMGLDWLERKENLLLMGAVGTGKTHMATAIGVEGCRRGKAVQFYCASDLVTLLQEKFTSAAISGFREKLKKVDLLIWDEVGYVPFSQTGSELLFNVIADCYERQSVIVTSNLEFGQWTAAKLSIFCLQNTPKPLSPSIFRVPDLDLSFIPNPSLFCNFMNTSMFFIYPSHSLHFRLKGVLLKGLSFLAMKNPLRSTRLSPS